MKILIAGASGAIGQPLLRLLAPQGYELFGITQSKERAEKIAQLGAQPIVLDVLQRDAVFGAIADLKPDIVIDMLTRLPTEYTPESMQRTSEMNAKIRLEGGANLQTAAEMHGAKRYIAQSSGFYYVPGSSLADESLPFAFDAPPGIAASARIYADIEHRVLNSQKIEGIALRFGFFYGPGTWFHPGESIAKQVLQQKYPIIGKGQGVWSFIHIDDAAQAIVAAIQCTPGIYNIVDDHPAAMRDWLPAFARYLGAPPPRTISEEEGLKEKGEGAVYYAHWLRGASNAKAKYVFNFAPRPLDWLTKSLSC